MIISCTLEPPGVFKSPEARVPCLYIQVKMLYVGMATVVHDSLHSSSLDSPQWTSATAPAEQRFSMGALLFYPGIW